MPVRPVASLVCLICALWGWAAIGEEPLRLDPTRFEPEQRLKMLLKSVAPYELTLAKEAEPLKLQPQPLLRFDNSVGGVVDGVVLIWTDRGRPAVLVQAFTITNGMWLHEFQSMADRPLVMTERGKPRWQPTKAGAAFRPLSDAPAPEASRGGRLSQMKSLARRFAVSEDFRVQASDRDTTKYELRLLPQPVYRYPEKEGGADGAIFAFVHGTDPEAVLVLEADPGEKSGWQYAWAPLTCWALQARLDKREIWSSPEMLGKSSPREPYHVWGFSPDPEPESGEK